MTLIVVLVFGEMILGLAFLGVGASLVPSWDPVVIEVGLFALVAMLVNNVTYDDVYLFDSRARRLVPPDTRAWWPLWATAMPLMLWFGFVLGFVANSTETGILVVAAVAFSMLIAMWMQAPHPRHGVLSSDYRYN